MENENRVMENDGENFPEFESIRKAVLEAREKVAATANAAMVAAY